ncbi:MAG: protein TolR [Gammaproteobacteria bacterium]|nr:MAG: protein TolR [Gammaproteobacteria bacterium]
MAVSRRKKKKLMSDINVVPYIDVMLVLLVIFMITAPLLTQGVKIELPQAASKPINSKDNETLVVTVSRSGRLYLDDRKISRKHLKTKISKILKIRPQTPVLVRGDRRVAYGKVIKVMTLLQDAGAPSIGLITETPAKNKK